MNPFRKKGRAPSKSPSVEALEALRARLDAASDRLEQWRSGMFDAFSK